MCFEIPQPITRRENRSRMTARYTKPFAIRMYVKSAAQAWLTLVSTRPGSRFGYTRCEWFESVVWTKARRISAWSENRFMIRRIRRSPTQRPRRRR
jgi:hypothetical protein